MYYHSAAGKLVQGAAVLSVPWNAACEHTDAGRKRSVGEIRKGLR